MQGQSCDTLTQGNWGDFKHLRVPGFQGKCLQGIVAAFTCWNLRELKWLALSIFHFQDFAGQQMQQESTTADIASQE